MLLAIFLAALAASGVGTSTSALAAAESAIEELRLEEAIALLEDAQRRERFRYDDHVRLYEQLGIAYAYSGDAERAIAAFRRMLAIDPQHGLRYTLSPKVTLLFEEARRAERASPQLELIWPRELVVGSAVPIDFEVVVDPLDLMDSVRLFVRRAGSRVYDPPRVVDIAKVESARLVLDPPDPLAVEPVELEVYATAIDRRGNEVLRWASADRPRVIHLDYRPRPEWYEQWWAWTIAAGVLAAGAGITVYAVTRSPNEEVPLTVGVER